MSNKVLVTGATGPVGNNTVKRLLELNIPVRAMVHKIDERSEALSAQGAEIVIGELTDFNSVSAAMKGISKAVFVYPVADGLLEATAMFVQAAEEEKVELIVNISQRTSVRNAPSHSAQAHWLAERLLLRSGVPVINLQPTIFMEWLLYFAQEIRENNRYISPFGEARYGTISSEDIGRSAAALVINPEGYIGQDVKIYGPEEVTGYDIAAAISEVTGREVTFAPIEPETFAKVLEQFNQPPYQIKHITHIGNMLPTGQFRGMNDNVEKITGTKPLSLQQFISKNIELFQKQ